MTPEKRKRWMESRTTHGAYVGGKEKCEHAIWRSMLSRCNNPRYGNYAYYGGRGIKVCKRWHKYENFIADMGCRPDAEHSLDRINTQKGYSPLNCRWATRSKQQKNKTTTKLYTNGKFTGTLVEVAEKINISKELAYWRFKSWGTFEKGKTWLLKKAS